MPTIFGISLDALLMSSTVLTSNCKQAITDNRLHPQYTTHNEYLLVFIIEHNLTGILAVIVFEEVKSSCWTVTDVTGMPRPMSSWLPSKTVCWAGVYGLQYRYTGIPNTGIPP